jgi:biofilm PGA synthesis lipoprotein PgaB
MTRLLRPLALLLTLIFASPVWAAQSFIALAYHNVEDTEPDQTYVGVSTERLISQLSWLQRNGYQPVTVDDLLAARDGGKPLPDKAVLLTFDDGYESFYTRVFPVLKAFRFPAVLALVGAWLEGGTDTTVRYAPDKIRPEQTAVVQFGDLKVRRDQFLTWDQLREIRDSGLVEIGSHSHDAHHGLPANPQGNSQPDVTTARFDPVTGLYESEASARRALNADTARMVEKITAELGRRPRVMVWPYGEHSETAISVAAANGLPIAFTLADGLATVDKLSAVPRHLINPDPTLATFVRELRSYTRAEPVRVVHVDLDYVYDPDPAQQERNLGVLVQRIHDMQINTVFLQAFADPTGDGLARAVYFPNRVLPMRADLFNRVSWQLRTRARVQVYAWMPVLAFDFGDGVATTLAWSAETPAGAADSNAYRRASLFDPAARAKILTLYEDLARHAPFEGLLFHDDAALSDFEDAGPFALKAYQQAGLPASIEALRADPRTLARWSRFKTDALIDFTQELAASTRRFRAPLKTARSLFAGPVLDPAAEAWFAQDLDRFLAAYDYAAVMAMPQMEGIPAAGADDWLRRLVAQIATRPEGLKRVIFELQSVDWRTEKKIPTEILGGQMRLLLRSGALNFGYYPDDFLIDHPNQARLHRDFSLQSYPARP